MATAFYSHPECRLHDMGDGHPECPQRLDAIADQLLASGVGLGLEQREAPLATLAQIERAHASNYVLELREFMEQVQASGEPRIARQVRRGGGGDLPVGEALHHRGGLEAADLEAHDPGREIDGSRRVKLDVCQTRS